MLTAGTHCAGFFIVGKFYIMHIMFLIAFPFFKSV